MEFDNIMLDLIRGATLAAVLGNYEGIVRVNRALMRIADRPALHCLQVWHNR